MQLRRRLGFGAKTGEVRGTRQIATQHHFQGDDAIEAFLLLRAPALGAPALEDSLTPIIEGSLAVFVFGLCVKIVGWLRVVASISEVTGAIAPDTPDIEAVENGCEDTVVTLRHPARGRRMFRLPFCA